MFLEHQPKEQMRYYERLLKAIGSLSKLFSESPEPYLASRATENLFCKAFEAKNLSRSDASADASKNKIGFGLKTFLEGNGRTLQKIAEFNSDHTRIKSFEPLKKIQEIARLRNERLESTKRIFGLDSIVYHCITRQVGKILVFETPAPLIDIEGIKDVSVTNSSIKFSDSTADYSFIPSKSTLYQRFITENVLLNVPVRIIGDPFVELEKLLSSAEPIFTPVKVQPHVFLPLYSNTGPKKEVQEKSGLNQWNAAGRTRDPNEVYLPIPSWIHRKFPNFFPPRDQAFELSLPDNTIMSAKVCQDSSKALMSNPNSALGKWLLRDILNLPEQTLLTYEKLETIGLDSVVIYKTDSGHYDIDFTRVGSYERFMLENT